MFASNAISNTTLSQRSIIQLDTEKPGKFGFPGFFDCVNGAEIGT